MNINNHVPSFGMYEHPVWCISTRRRQSKASCCSGMAAGEQHSHENKPLMPPKINTHDACPMQCIQAGFKLFHLWWIMTQT